MKLLNDYSFIRGVCHNPEPSKSKEQIDFELACAERLQVNSARFWIEQERWEKDPKGYFDLILDFVRRCNAHGISVMPILWNGNPIKEFHAPDELEWQKMREYAVAVLDLLHDEPNILMWDVMNEPYCNDYIRNCTDEIEKERRKDEIVALVRRMCKIVRELDPDGVLTVGHEFISHCPTTNDLIDVISFHDYLTTRAEIEAVYEEAEKQSRETGKPIINTETGCVGRTNPYDVELEICQKHKVGWYLFCLVTEGFWGDIHGIIYPDGTVRDPSIVAAMFGFFRNRTPERMRYRPNKEGHAFKAVEAVREVLDTREITLFHSKKVTSDDILEAVERCANLLEGAEMVPMWDLPSAKIADWRAQPEEERDLIAIRKFAYELARLVQENCLVL